ncbi:MAG: hypothetical protein ACE5JU_22840 [Candidatus Binatia bacterium]
MCVLLTLFLSLIASTALAQERMAFEGYEVSAYTRPRYITLSTGLRGVRRDLVVKIYLGDRLVAAITDDFLNGYGALYDYGLQRGFDTPGDVQAYWEAKDSLEIYWEPIDGLILVNNIPDATARQRLTAQWAAFYHRLFRLLARRFLQLDFPARRTPPPAQARK